jgi:23S rRNA (cytidine1920-2'-O)/16S rRNA (cytidine1409-2'-O)-methyltransferase
MQSSQKERIDVLMVKKQLASSREKAKRLIMAGLVFVGQQRVEKPGTLIKYNDIIQVKGYDNPYVSRGGLKLEKALKSFSVPVRDRVWIDVGASTGGFTHCLLVNGAKKVYSVDVGYGQLAWELRQDPRVVVMERTNIRNVQPEDFSDPLQGAVIDVSFISLKLILPVIINIVENRSHMVTLIKPQFEVGKGKVGRKGVVREQSLHVEVLIQILEFAESLNLKILALDFSPITGPEGNIEFLAHLYKGDAMPSITDYYSLSQRVVNKAHDYFSNR